MLSLFCMVVCVVAQPTKNTVHTIAITAMNFAASALTFVAIRGLVGQFTLISISSLEERLNKFLTNASEGDPRCDLRAVQHCVEKEPVILVVSAECPVTDLCKDGTRQVDTNHGLDLPHQVGAYAESSDLAADCGVKRPVKIVTGAQSDIWLRLLSRRSAS